MATQRKTSIGLLTFVFFAGFATQASATHFRGGHTSWERISGNTVRFTSTQEWDAHDIDTLPITPGDGDAPIIGPVVTLFSGVDLAGEPYSIVRYTVDHTYPSDGPFTAFLGSQSSSVHCCRLHSPCQRRW